MFLTKKWDLRQRIGWFQTTKKNVDDEVMADHKIMRNSDKSWAKMKNIFIKKKKELKSNVHLKYPSLDQKVKYLSLISWTSHDFPLSLDPSGFIEHFDF